MALYAFDGTWNEDKDGSMHDTNVFKFFQAYDRTSGETAERDVKTDEGNLYVPGIGTRWGWLGKLFGGLFGLGGRSRVQKALKRLKQNIANGDRVIDIVGFSRGAATAVHFANKIEERYGKGSSISIRCLGLWDIVGSFGLPGNRRDLGWNIDVIPDVVHHCYHAMALDEGRVMFPLTRPSASSPNDNSRAPGRLFEVWFRGSHSDVGGGNANPGLSSIALHWMLVRAKRHSLPIAEHHIQKSDKMRNPDKAVKHSDADKGVKERKVRWNDLVHESVSWRENENNPPINVALVNNLMETVRRFGSASAGTAV